MPTLGASFIWSFAHYLDLPAAAAPRRLVYLTNSTDECIAWMKTIAALSICGVAWKSRKRETESTLKSFPFWMWTGSKSGMLESRYSARSSDKLRVRVALFQQVRSRSFLLKFYGLKSKVFSTRASMLCVMIHPYHHFTHISIYRIGAFVINLQILSLKIGALRNVFLLLRLNILCHHD